MDSLKLLNNPSALNNKHSFTFLVLMLILSYVSNIYILIVVILSGILSMFLGVIIGNNIYGKIGAYRIVVLSWSYDILLLVIVLLIPNILLIVALLYYVLSIEVGRTPIDLIEGESELVSSFNTEYSGGEFVGFFLGEYLSILILLVILISVDFILLMWLYCVVMFTRASYPRNNYNEVVISMWNYVVVMIILAYII